jgi:hypothetical protein
MLTRRLIDVEHGDVGAVCGEDLAEPLPKDAASAGDDRGPPAEIEAITHDGLPPGVVA